VITVTATVVMRGVEPVLFWRRTDEFGCFSQWFHSPFEEGGVTFPTMEHYLMHAKARLFGDDESARKVLIAPTPEEAKALGRAVHGFDESVWARTREDIAFKGNLLKFQRHPKMLCDLMKTEGEVNYCWLLFF
jgi:ribA/ribD-fused uncharacterized protein